MSRRESGEVPAQSAAADREASARRRLALLDDPSGCARFTSLLADSTARESERSGEVLGGWRLEEKIGRGGMGEVYLAERGGGEFRQRAAVKILAPWVQHPELRRAFARERRILATLSHDGIARFLDGGIADDGTPYIALEYVEGESIVTWCQERNLAPRQRIEIFLGVCEAVEHAHWNLVVHRDLKPSNILIDARGRPKLLDFGIAKLVEGESEDQEPGTAADRTTWRALTPRYAAPEQLAGGPVTPATDVYALGLVLYELLADRPPFAVGGERPVDPAALLHEMKRAPPAPPSSAPRGGGRSGRWRWGGDLDRIVLAALALEPERRYRSAAALAADLRRYLEGRPVAARGDAVSYRMRRFVARHRVAVGATSAVALSLLLGFGEARVQARRAAAAARAAKLESERSEASLGFILDLFSRSDPAHAKGRSYTDDELLGLAAGQLEHDLASRPELALPLLHQLAVVRMQRGQNETALELARRELALRRFQDGPASPATAPARALVGNILWLLDRSREAVPFLRAALASLEANGEGSSSSAVEALANLAKAELDVGEMATAEALAKRAVAAARRGPDPGGAQAVAAIRLLSVVLLRRGHDAEAVIPAREAAEAMRRTLGIENPDTLIDYANLAILESNLGNNERTRAILDEIQPLEMRIFGPDRSDTLALARLRARLEEREGNFAAAEAAIERVLATLRSARPISPSSVAWSLTQAAGIYRAAGDLASAEARAREAGAVAARGELGTRSFTKVALADVLIDRGRLAEAGSLLREAEAEQQAQKSLTGALRAETLFARGRLALAEGRRTEARELLEAAADEVGRVAPRGTRSSPLLLQNLVASLDAEARGRRCAELLGRAVEQAQRFLGPRHPQRAGVERAARTCANAPS